MTQGTAVNLTTSNIATSQTTAQALTVTFPRGILGFEDCRQFRLESNPDWEPFAKLDSTDQRRLSFVIAPPRVFLRDYTAHIDPREVAELEINDAEDVDLWAIVTIPDDPHQMSVNLQGPIVINRANGKGKQVVLTRSHYSTRHLILGDETAVA